VYAQTEALLEEALHHELRLPRRPAKGRGRQRPVGLGDDVEPVRVEPRRSSGELLRLQAVGKHDQPAQRLIRGQNPSARLQPHGLRGISGAVLLDRRHRESGPEADLRDGRRGGNCGDQQRGEKACHARN